MPKLIRIIFLSGLSLAFTAGISFAQAQNRLSIEQVKDGLFMNRSIPGFYAEISGELE